LPEPLFAGESNSVPDFKASVALLGAALVILEVLRRSLASKTYSVIRLNLG
jgi:hypothetical protein